MSLSVGIIGCGNMGSALARGMAEARLLPPGRIVGYDVDPKKSGRLARGLKMKAARSVREAAACSVVLLAVKPQQMEEVLAEINGKLRSDCWVVSIAAGISTDWIEKRLGKGIRVVRVMPNMAAVARKSMSVVALGRSAKQEHFRTVRRILESVGDIVQVKEDWMNIATALSGSGPAYFFYLMEQMEKAGAEFGLPPATAHRLAVAASRGAAALMDRQGEDPPETLRAKVTSKGGTTEAAFKVFRKRGLGKILQEGIRAAARRAKELSA